MRNIWALVPLTEEYDSKNMKHFQGDLKRFAQNLIKLD